MNLRPTPSKTPEPTTTKIPEYSPFGQESWPKWAYDYWKDPETYAKTDSTAHEKFHTFLSEAWRSILNEQLKNNPIVAIKALQGAWNEWKPDQYFSWRKNGIRLTKDAVSQLNAETATALLKGATDEDLLAIMLSMQGVLPVEKRTPLTVSPKELARMASQEPFLAYPYYSDDPQPSWITKKNPR